MIRAIMIPTMYSMPSVIELPDTVRGQNDAICDMIGCDLFDIVRVSDDALLFVDDEGLLRGLLPNPTAMMVSQYPQMLVGAAVLVGIAGDTIDNVPDRYIDALCREV